MGGPCPASQRCGRAKLCARVRESVLPTAGVVELKICSGTCLSTPLPEPIVKEVASGQVEIAHRYDGVTVVQADMGDWR